MQEGSVGFADVMSGQKGAISPYLRDIQSQAGTWIQLCIGRIGRNGLGAMVESAHSFICTRICTRIRAARAEMSALSRMARSAKSNVPGGKGLALFWFAKGDFAV